MTFFNGTTEDTELAHHSGLDDVVIKIRGRTAARFLGRADVEKRIVKELDALQQRLTTMEAAAAQRTTQQEALSTAVESLQEKVGQLSGRVADQVAEIRAELGRLRSEFDM